MDKKLLSMLVCPVCKGELKYESRLFKSADKKLICEHDRLVFPIRDGIPLLTLLDAKKL